MSARVLVTGASGFIGSRVVPLLAERGCEVHAVSRRPAAREAAAAIWHALDLADHRTVDRTLASIRPTHLLHLAWETAHGSYYTAPENLDHLRDALQLVRAFIREGGRRIVGAGSSAEYELTGDTDLVEDVTPLRPNGLYGTCKKALFEVIASSARQAGIGHAWARIFFCYGPGEHPSRLVPSLLRALATHERVPFQEGRSVRDYIHVEDVAEAFAALVLSDVDGAMNVGSGSPILLRDFVSALAAAGGRPGAIDFGRLPTPVYEPRRVVADIGRIRSALGWAPRRALADGLRETVTWWRARDAMSVAAGRSGTR